MAMTDSGSKGKNSRINRVEPPFSQAKLRKLNPKVW
jgi:hypothetical protein